MPPSVASFWALRPAAVHRPADPPRLRLDEALERLPARTVGRGARPGDPFNLLFAGSEEAVRGALRAGGWSEIPRSLPLSLAAALRDGLRGRLFDRFPPMNLYLAFDRFQDLNFGITVRSFLERHHFRLWRAPFDDPEGRPVWWGAGNYDLSVRWRDLSHRPDPDADRERDFVAETLRRPGGPALELIPFPRAVRTGANDKGYPFQTDGRLLKAVF